MIAGIEIQYGVPVRKLEASRLKVLSKQEDIEEAIKQIAAKRKKAQIAKI
jgi:hypothetical protein